jgi:Flp pilus assembly protein TadD
LNARLATLMQEAERACEASDFERAEPLLREIVATNPRDADAWHMLAIIALRGARAAEAIDASKHAHQLERRNHLFLNTLGVAHAEAGELEEASRSFARALKERPAHAETHYNLGKLQEKLGRTAEAERSYLRARQLEPGRADVANNLGALHSRQGRAREALLYLGEARAALPDDAAVAINYSIALHAEAGPAAAIEALSSFLVRNPAAAAVHAELGRRLLAQGRFADGWREYAWRRGRPPESFNISGKRVLLQPEQGLGDHLFFLRFAPILRRRVAHVAFACPSKLRALLEGTGVVDELQTPAQYDVSLPLGELPRLLEERGTPPAVSLRPHVEWQEKLASLGPPPYLGVTWRAGSKREHEAEFGARGEDALYKEIPLAAFATALRGWRGTVLVLQRAPLQGEMEAFSKALGQRAHDLSALNDNLVAMTSLLAYIDEYVGVSNLNMHLRAGAARAARVLVPFPAEFRWMHTGERSPWFPASPLYRQSAGREWAGPLNRLKLDLSA